MDKDTTAIIEELCLCDDFKTFYDENKEYMIQSTLSDMLSELIIKKGLQKADVIQHSELSQVYGYQILSGKRKPDRKKLLCIALAMALTIDETQLLLKCAGYAPLYVKIPSDSVVLYAICKNLTVLETNSLLFSNGLETLG